MSRWLSRHPLVRDALLWAIPALFFGAALRLILLYYSPYAYWGSDSRSYFGFTNGVLSEFYFSLNEKRRYLYPIFLLPVTLLPGSALKALAWIQAGLGLATVLAFSYFVRRVFVGWKVLIVPLTLLFAGLPSFLWYEHELIADTIYFDCVIWAMAGWAAWVSQHDPVRARRLWWVFFVPLAIMVLTKPSVKFFWPGIVLALVVVLAWRVLRWKEWAVIGALFLAGLTVGDDDQSAWLLYTTAFPLTQIDTPKHAEYKREIRGWVLEKRTRLDFYQDEDDEVHDFLREPEAQESRRLWRDLAKKDERALQRLYRDLALEGVIARPDLFLKIGLQRLAGSANLTDFVDDRFRPSYFADRFADQLAKKRNPESMVRLAFALPSDVPLPPAAQFRDWLSPHPDSQAARWMQDYVRTYQSLGVLVLRPGEHSEIAGRYRITLLGFWLALGMLCALFPPYLRTLGVWVILMGSALLGTYLVGIEHTRYFAPAWPIIFLALAVALDWPIRLGLDLMHRRAR
jgi:hypothetical protein